MYKKGETIIYPVYGISKINRIYREKVDGKDMEYYEILFANNLYISVPTDQAEKLGMRYPLSKTELKKAIKDMDKKVKVKEETVAALADISKEKLATGDTSDAVQLIRMINSVGVMKKVKNHTLSITEKSNLTSALEFVKSELRSVFGEKGLNSFKFKSFEVEE